MGAIFIFLYLVHVLGLLEQGRMAVKPYQPIQEDSSFVCGIASWPCAWLLLQLYWWPGSPVCSQLTADNRLVLDHIRVTQILVYIGWLYSQIHLISLFFFSVSNEQFFFRGRYSDMRKSLKCISTRFTDTSKNLMLISALATVKDTSYFPEDLQWQ